MRYQRSQQAEEYRKLYRTGRWKRLRTIQLQTEPLCRMCAKSGRVTAAIVCDHIQPHKGDEELFYSPANHQSLCAPCHDSAKQSEERRGYSKAVGVDGWPIDESHPANASRVR